MTAGPGARGPRVAFFGGSFDPPHVGHLLVCAYVLGTQDIDEVCVVPTFDHHLKEGSSASFEDRFAMTELAFAELRRAHVSRLEEELGGRSLTLRSLEELKRRRPDSELRIVLGTDLQNETDRWHRFDRIVEIAPPIWVGREGYVETAATSDEPLPIVIPNVNSTELRLRLASGSSAAGWLHPAVDRFIRERGLYDAPRAS